MPPTPIEGERTLLRKRLVDQSIALHGGPYGGCQPCHEAEERTLKAISGTAADWQRHSEAWLRHLATD